MRSQSHNSFFNMQLLEQLLEKYAEGDTRAQKMLSDPKRRLHAYINKEMNGRKLRRENLLSCVMSSMAAYITEFPTTPLFRQKLWDCCNAWLMRIAEGEGLPLEPDEFEVIIPKPVVKNTGIALVKALHEEKGKTKKQLAKAMGVSTKTIQTGLHALDPELGEDDANNKREFRVGGQLLRVKIKRDETNPKQPIYSTPDRLHPVILQLNTMQVGVLMQALQKWNDLRDSTVSRELAIDVWSQISEKGQTRIKDVFGQFDEDLTAFFSDITGETDLELHSQFQTEAEMIDQISSMEEQLQIAFKSGERYSFTLRLDGKKQYLKDQRITWKFGDGWLAWPAAESPDSPNASSFKTEDVVGFLELYK